MNAPSEEERDTMVEMPLVVKGPWTREARERAAADEVHQAFIRYFRKAMKVRNWVPWDDLPVREMAERGHLLSEDTVTIGPGLSSASRTTLATTSSTA